MMGNNKEVRLKFVHCTDIHGNYFPYDFIRDRSGNASIGSLCRLHTYVTEQREKYKDALVLLDGGDMLQGQPSAYFYNVVDTRSKHLAAQMMNYMKFDACTIGNHDIETGHEVYDRFVEQCEFPILAANILNEKTGEPYFTPYIILHREGVKIAVLGLTSPMLANWFPHRLWSGLKPVDMLESAKYWVNRIKEEEKPDVLVGLFHSGKDEGMVMPNGKENASWEVAQQVPGFDIVFFGHDHVRRLDWVENVNGDKVCCIDPGANAYKVSDVEMIVTKCDGKVVDKKIIPQLADIHDLDINGNELFQQFRAQYYAVKSYVSHRVGEIKHQIEENKAYFGPCAFVDFIHHVQLDKTGADVSFAAPLSYNSVLRGGALTMRDMFKFYRYENSLYTMRLKGSEIKDYLEYSYMKWVDVMTSPNDHLLLLDTTNAPRHYGFKNPNFNFDSAVGIVYEVDVTKPAGEKISIKSMRNGEPFSMDADYTVAMNAYRANGGGEILTKGCGIPHDELESRVVDATPYDIRYYITEYIKKKQRIDPKPFNSWKFVPEDWCRKAAARDARLLFDD